MHLRKRDPFTHNSVFTMNDADVENKTSIVTIDVNGNVSILISNEFPTHFSVQCPVLVLLSTGGIIHPEYEKDPMETI